MYGQSKSRLKVDEKFHRKIPMPFFNFSDGIWVLGQISPPHVHSTSSGVSANLIFYDEAPMDEVPTIVLTPTTNQIIAYILLRSCDTPLTISLHFPTKSPELENIVSSAWRPLFNVLLAQFARWGTLDLVAPAKIWEAFASIPQARLALLQKVDGTLPHVRGFFLVFKCCSNVRDLAVELEVSTPHLLDGITAPNLMSLTVMNKSSIISSSRVPQILDFIRRSGCSLTNLELHWNGTADELFDVLSSTPTVESLSLFHNDFKVAFDKRMKLLPSLLPNTAWCLHKSNCAYPLFSAYWPLRRDGPGFVILHVASYELSGGMTSFLSTLTISPVLTWVVISFALLGGYWYCERLSEHLETN
ncbi:hypothetical protein ARMGADRAFT_1028472 [Armillaria gallica]|uniref:Uncharacterized protein n=1 Tax=Armillaria gallica TaxID=47427 RepID=A0A2H3DIJ6_ARMGA|nr:hypothetical protein ARMGADRAFT_1028472 [Armillaria gallica]